MAADLEVVSYAPQIGGPRHGWPQDNLRYPPEEGQPEAMMQLWNGRPVHLLYDRDVITNLHRLSNTDFIMQGVLEDGDATSGNVIRNEYDQLKNPTCHKESRMATGRYFTGTYLESYRSQFRQIAMDAAHDVNLKLMDPDADVDFIADFASPFNDGFIATLWGVSPEEGRIIRETSSVALNIVEGSHSLDASPEAFIALDAFSKRQLRRYRQQNEASLEEQEDENLFQHSVRGLDRMKRSARNGFSDQDVEGNLRTGYTGGMTPWFVGNIIGVELLQRPRLVKQLGDNIEEWEKRVEQFEAYRGHFVIGNPRRNPNTGDPVDLGGGVIIGQGELAIASLGAAIYGPVAHGHHRDFDSFEDDDAALAFSKGGPHACPAKDLARVVLGEGMRAFYTEVQDVEMAVPPEDLTYVHGLLPQPNVIPLRRRRGRTVSVAEAA